MPGRNVNLLFGLLFDEEGIDDVVRFAEDLFSREGQAPRCIATVNFDFVVNSLRDAEFRRELLDSDLCCPDGMPLVWLEDFLGLRRSRG